MEERFWFDPVTYRALMNEEIADYPELQSQVSQACAHRQVRHVLDLGVGTGETALGVLAHHPRAQIVGLDENTAMLDHARARLPTSALLRVGRLEEALPPGPFDLVVSTLAVHHLDAAGKEELFQRVAAVLAPGGRFVLADLVVPENPADVHTHIDWVYDLPSPLSDQCVWLERAGLVVTVAWRYRDLASITADRCDGAPAAS